MQISKLYYNRYTVHYKKHLIAEKNQKNGICIYQYACIMVPDIVEDCREYGGLLLKQTMKSLGGTRGSINVVQ